MSSERPVCPVCLGTQKRMSVVGELPCTNCDGGFMRGVTDPTDDEARISELQSQLATLRAERDAIWRGSGE